MELQGKVALVTGASRGLGMNIALELARRGADVALAARTVEAGEVAIPGTLRETAAKIEALGRRALPVKTDLADPDQVVAMVETTVAELGGIDLLVNNAGRIDTEVPLWEADADEWWQVVETNVRGPFLLARHVVPAMLARGGGRVVDVNSGAGTHDMAVASAYNVSKTALLRLGHHLHVAGTGSGLRVFEVAPGTVATDMTGSMAMHADRTEWTPVERTVEMVAAIASGDLDACSGWYVRVTHDTPSSLRKLVETGTGPTSRHLRVLPANGSDRLGPDLTGR